MTSESLFDRQQGPALISLQCLYKALGFLSGGPMHSSNSTNTEAQLSMGWSGVNFTAGETSVCDCSGLLLYPGHAYSAAGPWAATEGQRASAPCPKPNPRLFTFFSFFSLPSQLFFFCTLPCVSLLLPTVKRAEEID